MLSKTKDLSERTLGWLLLTPVALLLAIVVLYPVGQLVYSSFFTIRLTEPWLGTPFVGFDNYMKAWEDERFWGALSNTLLFIVEIGRAHV